MASSEPNGVTPARGSRVVARGGTGRAASGVPLPSAAGQIVSQAGPAAGAPVPKEPPATGSGKQSPTGLNIAGGSAASKGGAVRAAPAIAPVRDSDQRVEWVRSAVARFERPLTQYAVHILSGDLERARDLVQEAFLRLCDQDQQAVEGHIAEWLYTVCRNLAIDLKRKERRMRLISEEQQDSFATDYESPTDAAERVDAYSRVVEVMQGLPPRQQEIVRLKFQHGMSYKEIGQVMELTATNVGFILHTAIKVLRERLGSEAVPGVAPTGGAAEL